MKKNALLVAAALFAALNWLWAGYIVWTGLVPWEAPSGKSASDDQSGFMGMLMALCMTVLVATLVTAWLAHQVRSRRRVR